IRKFYGLEDFITMRHLDNMAKVLLATGLLVAYGYMMETFLAWYSGNHFEQYVIANRMRGPYAPAYWTLMLCNVLVPQALWSQRVRKNVLALWVIAMFVNVGMWLERFIIIVTSLHRDFLPSSWEMYYPTIWDYATLFGTIGLFLALLFLFIRFLPLIVLIGSLVGCASGFLLQYWGSVSYYPLNIGGRPLNSWPAFIPITFEMTILLAALSAVLGMLALNGLPMPYHPVFNVERFALASRNRFFLAIKARDAKFDREGTRQFLQSLTPYGVFDIEH
ncbi:MAG: DUF3341 domain-containing protein, partial [Planctomycetota bacterium]